MLDMTTNKIDVQKESKQFGFTKAECLQLWEDGDWKEVVLTTCRDVAQCVHAEPADRELAIAMWGTLVGFGLAPEETPDGKPFLAVLRDTQLQIARGRKVALDEKVRDDMNERVTGVKWIMGTIRNFINLDQLMVDQLTKLGITAPDNADSN